MNSITDWTIEKRLNYDLFSYFESSKKKVNAIDYFLYVNQDVLIISKLFLNFYNTFSINCHRRTIILYTTFFETLFKGFY